MSEQPREARPATGAMWFPDEGGIMFQGKAYYPADYVLTRDDIRRVKAGALTEAADEFQSRLPDGTGNGRAYNSYTVAGILRARAAELREGTK